MGPTIVHEVDAVARRSPDAPSVSWRGGAWTYGDLRRAIGAAQHRLEGLGLERGARVALLVGNSPEYVATFYGVLAAGYVAVPLNVQEPSSVLRRQIEHVGCRAIVADEDRPEWRRLLETGLQDCKGVVFRLTDGSDRCDAFCQLGAGQEAPAIVPCVPSELAMIIFTSGTTSQPKAVMLSHGNLVANAAAIKEYLGIRPSDKVLCLLPFHFSYGNSVLNSNLIAGAQLLIEDNLAFPHITMQRLQDERVTGLPGVPSTFALLLGRCRFADYDLSHLRYVTQAGGPMPRPHLEQLRAHLPNARVYVMYGQTEATARLTYLSPDRLADKLGSVGLPISGMEIDIRDGSGSKPRGEVGEICARGSSVMLGYWGDDEQTAAALRDGWLHTGDLGHQDAEGYLYIDGRVTEMIKVGAFRVSPLEVEEVIAGHPSVQEVAVTAVADETLGQAVKAVILVRGDAQLDVRAVKAYCRGKLASYKVPKVVEFATALPRTSSGKVQRHKLI